MIKRLLAISFFAALPLYPAHASAPSFVPVEGGTIAYESCSPKTAAQTIILIHDGLVDSAVWNGVWQTLCETFHTVRFDERGYGKSPQSTVPYSSVDDIGAVMAALHIKRATLVGSSANGGRALAFALKHPETVDTLIVSGPSVPGVPYTDDFLKLLRPFGERVAIGDLQGAIMAAEQSSYLVAPGNSAARQTFGGLLRAHPHDLQMRPLEKPDEPIVERLGELKIKTLIVVGDSDHANNLNHARIAHEKITGSTFVTIKNAGHLPYLEHPQEFAQIVRAFIQDLSR